MMQKILGKISIVHKFPVFEKYINYKTFWGPYKRETQTSKKSQLN